MQRDKLEKHEKDKLQREYHKGTEAQKRVMRELFGQGLTYSSGMARCNSRIEEKRIAALAARLRGCGTGASISPHSDMTESEFWDWSSRVAWHGILWKHELFDKSIPFWIELHRQYAGWGLRIKEQNDNNDRTSYHLDALRNNSAEETYRMLVPGEIPHTWQTRAWQAGHFILANAVKVASAVIIAALGAVAALILERALVG